MVILRVMPFDKDLRHRASLNLALASRIGLEVVTYLFQDSGLGRSVGFCSCTLQGEGRHMT